MDYSVNELIDQLYSAIRFGKAGGGHSVIIGMRSAREIIARLEELNRILEKKNKDDSSSYYTEEVKDDSSWNFVG